VAVAENLSFRLIDVGTRQACGITLEGRAYCWGDNESAELGIGRNGGRSAIPLLVVGELRFRDLALADHSCGLIEHDNIYCWGITYGGALGNGVVGPGVRTSPSRVRPPVR
jgi:alpha-tubulin suppressor-like RCC1 family protein